MKGISKRILIGFICIIVSIVCVVCLFVPKKSAPAKQIFTLCEAVSEGNISKIRSLIPQELSGLAGVIPASEYNDLIDSYRNKWTPSGNTFQSAKLIACFIEPTDNFSEVDAIPSIEVKSIDPYGNTVTTRYSTSIRLINLGGRFVIE